jgi:lysozyme
MDIQQTSPVFEPQAGFALSSTASAHLGLGKLKPETHSAPLTAPLKTDLATDSTGDLPRLNGKGRQFSKPSSPRIEDASDDTVVQTPANWRRIAQTAARDEAAPSKSKPNEQADLLTGLGKNRSLSDNDGLSASATRAGLPYPGRLLRYVPGAPLRFDRAAQQWQMRMRERGWSIQTDGLYGAQSARICRQFQQEKGLQVDGVVGAATWAAAFKADNLTNPQPSPGSTTQINARGLELVKKFEGLVLTAYRDPVGIWTIGYGHTGPEVGPGDVITKAQAEALLKRDLARFESAVRNLVKVPLSSNQFSALVSFTYNVGSGALAQSTLLALLNQRNYQGAADQFPRWVNGGGQVLPGLVRRRNEERALFLTRG